jgi:hypothetical protein
MLGAGQGSAQLAHHLDEAHFQVDSLIFEGFCYGAHTALTLVGSHCGGVDFNTVGRGYALGKSKSDVLTIGSALWQRAFASSTSLC